MFFDKKAQGISMTYIVIAALALIVLIVIVLFFTGGMEKLFKAEVGVVEGAGGEQATWISRCRAYCSAGQIEVFNSVKFGDDKKSCSNLGVKCDEAGTESGSGDTGSGTLASLPSVEEEKKEVDLGEKVLTSEQIEQVAN